MVRNCTTGMSSRPSGLSRVNEATRPGPRYFRMSCAEMTETMFSTAACAVTERRLEPMTEVIATDAREELAKAPPASWLHVLRTLLQRSSWCRIRQNKSRSRPSAGDINILATQPLAIFWQIVGKQLLQLGSLGWRAAPANLFVGVSEETKERIREPSGSKKDHHFNRVRRPSEINFTVLGQATC